MTKALFALLLALVIPLTAEATSITFVGSDGTRRAEATFDDGVAGFLTITLTNTSLSDSVKTTDILTAVSFDLKGAVLSPVSASLAPGSTVLYDSDGQPDGGIVGGEWALKSAKSGVMIYSSGLGPFGPGESFPGDDLAPDLGVQYGLLSTGDEPDKGFAKSGGLIKNSVVFVLAFKGKGGLELNNVQQVVFHYGSSLKDKGIAGQKVPDGATTLSLLGLGLVGVAGLRRKVRPH